MVDENQIATTIFKDSDVQVEEYSRYPFEMIISHELESEIPSGLSMLFERHNVEAEVLSDWEQKDEIRGIERFTKIKVTE